MKYTIEGFSQSFAMTLKKEVTTNGKTVTRKIDCTDLVILRWFVDFYPNMKKIEVDGKQFAWLTHKKLIEDLPIVDITKRAFIDRMQKLVDFNILEYKLLKDGGTFSLYGFGKNYKKMISNDIGCDGQTAQGMQSNDIGCDGQTAQGMQSNDIGCDGQTHNKDNSIINQSIKDKSINKYIAVIEYLNSKAGTSYRASAQATQRHINARINDGFTLDDFKTVIDKKCSEWLNNAEMSKYLRPETLFGSKFESYLNAPATAPRKTYGANGVEIKTDAPDDLAGIL